MGEREALIHHPMEIQTDCMLLPSRREREREREREKDRLGGGQNESSFGTSSGRCMCAFELQSLIEASPISIKTSGPIEGGT